MVSKRQIQEELTSESESEPEVNPSLVLGSDSESEDELELELSQSESESDLQNDVTDPETYNTSDSDFESGDDVEYTTGADGYPRELKPPIDPVYSSDDSDAEEPNTIGNIPISAYDKMPHIGYDIDGKRIMRPASASAIDSLLESIDLPKGWTGLIDKATGKSLNLSKEEMDLINRVQGGMLPTDDIDPFVDQEEWFSSKVEVAPLLATPEPKRRFVPSKHEAKRVMKLVHAIREGRLTLKEPQAFDDDDRQMVLSSKLYDVWSNEKDIKEDGERLRAPKMAPPTHEESYNPPEEYLFNDDEKEKWESTDPQDRETNFVPKKFDALRKVPGYSESLRERFERCLDLYLAPRLRKQRLSIDPESLIPDLPSPKDLRPFPIRTSTVYQGHEGRIRCLSVDPTGQFLATGGEDGSVRVWEVITGRELWRCDILKDDSYDEGDGSHPDDRLDAISWNPRESTGVLAIAGGENIYVAVPGPGIFDPAVENTGLEMIEAGWGFSAGGNQARASTNTADDNGNETDGKPAKSYAKWTKPVARLSKKGVGIVVRAPKRCRRIDWHAKGDYFVSTHPEAANSSVLVHQLSKHTSQSPFKKSKGIIQDAKFHPFRPHLYVASQRYLRIYDLSAQKLIKRLLPGVKWLSSFDIHPRGDNVITGSYDKRVTWHDLELNETPYKILRYHSKAVRDVKFHPKLPLFCSASDDGHINVLHATVYDDLLKNPLLVPLKILKGHKVTGSLGVLQVMWHPREAWLFSVGSDGTARLWTT